MAAKWSETGGRRSFHFVRPWQRSPGAGGSGCFLIRGMFASALGSNDLGKDRLGPEGASWAFWGGIAAMVVAGVGFWIVGRIAKVPMWIQGPEFGSARAYVRGRGD